MQEPKPTDYGLTDRKRVVPLLVAFLVAYTLLTVACQVYVTKNHTDLVLKRLDALAAEVKAIKAATVKSDAAIATGAAAGRANTERLDKEPERKP